MTDCLGWAVGRLVEGVVSFVVCWCVGDAVKSEIVVPMIFHLNEEHQKSDSY